MGEVAAFAQLLSQMSLLTTIAERVCFARARMGTYDLIDFAVVLVGYALSGEPTLQAFYECLLPFDESQLNRAIPKLSVPACLGAKQKEK